MSEILTQSISTMEEWRSIAKEFTYLHEQTSNATFFLSWEWLFSWSEVCIDNNRDLFILAFYEKGALIGFAPFYIFKRNMGAFTVKELRFLGTPESGSDFLDILIKKGREKEISNLIYDYLHEEGRSSWDKLLLSDIRADSLFLLYFVNRLDEEGRYSELKRGAYCPAIKLPENEENLYATMSPGWRKKFKQDFRVSNRDHKVTHVIIKGSEISDKLEEFFKYYEEKSGWKSELLHSLLKKLVDKYDEEKPFQIDYLYFDGKLLAALFHFKFKLTVSMYLMAVDKKHNPKISLGNLLVGYCIKNAISLGFEHYDFLKGDERYKFHWSNSGHCSLRLSVWQKNPVGYCLALVKLTRDMGKLLLR